MNKGLKIALVVCILVILGLSGYIVYDKFIQKEEKKDPVTVVEPSTNNSAKTLLTNEEAINEVSTLYTKVRKILTNNEGFKINNVGVDENGICKSGNCYAEVTNYNEYLNTIFTANGKKTFESYEIVKSNYDLTKNPVRYDRNYTSSTLSDVSYMGVEFTVTTIEENKITFNAMTKVCNDADWQMNHDLTCPTDKIEKTSLSEYTIVKENNIWKLESYKLGL